MSSEPRLFDHWWKGSPLVQNADSGTFGFWWRGAVVLQKAPTLQNVVVVGSGGIAIGGAATVVHNTSSLQYGGIAVGGSAPMAVNFNSSRPGIIVTSYTGNGGGARSLSISGYTPIAAMVMGRDGSNHEIGAMRIRGETAGKSMPWVEEATSGSSTRLNRITAFNSDGISVGTDLNVNGVPYIVIVFPEIVGFCEAGSYVGSGVTGTGATLITTNVAGGTFLALSPLWTAGDVGRRIFHSTDRTLVGTITHVTDSTHAEGTVVQALTGTTDWYFEARLIPLGMVPDLVFLQCSDATGATVSPLPIIPTIESLGGGAIPVSSVTNHDYTGTGRTPAVVGIESGSSDLLVINTNTTYPATDGYDGDGKTYLWLALKADPSVGAFDKILYTGDGTSTRSISPIGFSPEFAMAFGDSVAPGFQDKAAAVANTGFAFPFIDGNGASGTGWSFLSDGIQFVNNGYNVSTRNYAVFFLRSAFHGNGGIAVGGSAEYIYTITVPPRKKHFKQGQGGIRIGGKAKVFHKHIGPPNPPSRFVYHGDGGIKIGGAATTHLIHSITGSGGIAIGGTATAGFVRTITGSGGIAIGGAANILAQYAAAVSGGIAIGGAAEYTYTIVVPPRKKHVKQGQGGIRIGGKAKIFHKHVGPPNPPSRFVYHGDGGIAIGGAAFFDVKFVPSTSGGIAIGGAASVDVNFVVSPSGGIAVGGAATIARIFGPTVSGGIAIGGTAGLVANFVVSPEGGIAIGGAATVVTNTPVTYTVVGSGGIVIGGAADTNVIYVPGIGGGIAIGGEALCKFIPAVNPVPPRPTPGAVGGFIPTRQPFWAAPGTRVNALIIEPAASVHGTLRTVEDELASEENQLLGLL